MKILIVRTYSDNDAALRLQTSAIWRGLEHDPIVGVTCDLYKTGSPNFSKYSDADCICFHCHDMEAIAFLRKNLHFVPQALIICFGADIYSYDIYTKLNDFVDFYIVPTKLHQSILSAQFETPVYVLPEPIDPISITENFDWTFPIKQTKHLGWFGYPESFYKGMLSLIPVIQQSITNGDVDSFTLITNKESFSNDFNFKLKHFIRDTFVTDLQSFDYVVLSHFPLDLHINSLIKSPNKAITALAAGVIPLATDTPSYRELFTSLGIEKFLITSPRSLSNTFSTLNPQNDSNFIREKGVLELIRTRFTDSNTTKTFIDIVNDFHQNELSWGKSDKAIPITHSRFSANKEQDKTLLRRIKRSINDFLIHK